MLHFITLLLTLHIHETSNREADITLLPTHLFILLSPHPQTSLSVRVETFSFFHYSLISLKLSQPCFFIPYFLSLLTIYCPPQRLTQSPRFPLTSCHLFCNRLQSSLIHPLPFSSFFFFSSFFHPLWVYLTAWIMQEVPPLLVLWYFLKCERACVCVYSDVT